METLRENTQHPTKDALGVWESEGGTPGQPSEETIDYPIDSASNSPIAPNNRMTGSIYQIEWAQRIKARVNTEFDRVAKLMKSAAGKQGEPDRTDTEAVISILEEKRAEVMARDEAGYFIHDWQQSGDQVLQMILNDSRYVAIKNRKAARKVIPV